MGLHIIQNGNLTTRTYADGILRLRVLPYSSAIGYSFILMHDNARHHTARFADNMLLAEIIWSDQHTPLTKIRSSIFGTHLDISSVYCPRLDTEFLEVRNRFP